MKNTYNIRIKDVAGNILFEFKSVEPTKITNKNIVIQTSEGFKIPQTIDLEVTADNVIIEELYNNIQIVEGE